MNTFTDMVLGVDKGELWVREAWLIIGKRYNGYLRKSAVKPIINVFVPGHEIPSSYQFNFNDYRATDWIKILDDQWPEGIRKL